MKADLHLHSRCSDGSLKIEELVLLAAGSGLDTISIADHDTTNGVSRAMEAGAKALIKIIPGLEISAFDPETGAKVHILGYDYKLPAANIEALCSPLLKRRDQNTLRQLKIIASFGYEISEAEVRAEAGESPALYKQHIMAVLIGKGYANAIYSDLYYKLFKGKGMASGDIEYVHYSDAIAAILADGGVPVLAHPGKPSNLKLIEKLEPLGLMGLELEHPHNNPADKTEILQTAGRFGLMLTGGSDFHGKYGSAAKLGEYRAPESFYGSWKKLGRSLSKKTALKIS